MQSPGIGPPTSEEVLTGFLNQEKEDLFRALCSASASHEELLTLRGRALAVKSMQTRVDILLKKSRT